MRIISKPTLIFESWTDSTAAVFRRSLAELPIVDQGAAVRATERSDVFVTANADHVEDFAARYTASDAAENEAELENVDCTFDYCFEIQIIEGPHRLTAPSITTRLNPIDPSKGKIMYGMRFYRIGLDAFLYWPDED